MPSQWSDLGTKQYANKRYVELHINYLRKGICQSRYKMQHVPTVNIIKVDMTIATAASQARVSKVSAPSNR